MFMGTPEFAVPSLLRLVNSDHTVVGVVTQPDRSKKRGKVEPCAVKAAAERLGLAVFQPNRIRDEEARLREFGADIGVTAAYGQILTQDVLDAFPKGVVNVHASLLPKYRGASPVYSAILAGERETGVTIMRTELGLDTGDILASVKTEIGERETATELTARLAELGAELLVKTLDGYDGITAVKQDDGAATKCRTIKKSEEYIDFTRDAKSAVDQIRALADTPCAKTVIGGEVYKIYAAAELDANGRAGEIIECGKRLAIACGSGAVEILSVQAPGKRKLDTAEFLRGRKFKIGEVCGKPQ